MCAIFACDSYKGFLDLYNRNIDRGDFAFGGLYLDREHFCIYKKEGRVNLLNTTIRDVFGDQRDIKDFQYFIGHTQAPTSSKQTFDVETTHPFTIYPWIVAHNGILTNFTELQKKLSVHDYNEVDSSVIPALLYYHSDKFSSEVDLILHVLKMLKGTYSLWIFNAITRNLYFSRCGSTLFADLLSNTVSSVKIEAFI